MNQDCPVFRPRRSKFTRTTFYSFLNSILSKNRRRSAETLLKNELYFPREEKTSFCYACKARWYGFLFARKIMLCALRARSPGLQAYLFIISMTKLYLPTSSLIINNCMPLNQSASSDFVMLIIMNITKKII